MDYYGLAVDRLENEFLQVDYLIDGGPRLVGLRLKGSPFNFLAETPEISWETPYGEYRLLGGHRLWPAPERVEWTYPDNGGLTVCQNRLGVLLRGPVELPTGLQRSLFIQMEEGHAALCVIHRITNHSDQALELAPWAITMMAPGGQALVPLDPTPVDPDGLQPNRKLVLWPYSRWDDRRLGIGEKLIRVRWQPIREPCKIGTFNRCGWVAYLHPGGVFVKRCTPFYGQIYPDLGCNVEVYTNDRFVELETLGPLQRLQTGETVEHVEEWQIFTDLEACGEANPDLRNLL